MTAMAILPQFAEILDRPWRYLVDLDIAATEWLAGELAITTPRYRASQVGIEGDRNGRLIGLCRRFRATRYLSGDSARDYIDIERFRAARVEVIWHSYQHPHYPQLHGDFVP